MGTNAHWTRAADICVIVLCAVLLGVLIRQELSRSKATRNRPVAPLSLIGTKVPGLSTAPGPEVQILLELSPDCPFCLRSAGFYRVLTNAAETSHGLLVIAAKFPAGSRHNAFLAENGLQQVKDIGTIEKEVSTGYFPTLLIAGPDGRIKNAWDGYLGPSEQGEVVAEIRKLCRACVSTE